ncbi:MAG: rhomboid family intramembrane serine protease [bacterium]|nr:rhomboid family intramembrane serine protease [bacterium]
MIPIRDHERSGKTPVVTYLLLGVNVVVFVYMMTLGHSLEDFVKQYGLIPALITNGEAWPSFISSIFLHGGFGHLFGNMLFLHVFGDNLEAHLGRLRYLLFYLASGIAASLAHSMFNADSIIPTVGASGAIAGLMGAYLALFPRARIDVLWTFGFYFQKATVPASFMLLYWIVFQVIFGVGSLGIDGAGVAYFAHIGGFVFGYFLLKFLSRNRPKIVNVGF